MASNRKSQTDSSQTDSNESENEAAEAKRTTYTARLNVTEIMPDGTERLIYGEETKRAYGEGEPVAAVVSVRDRFAALGRKFDPERDVDSPFVNRIRIDDRHNIYVGVIWKSAPQCQSCGALRNQPHPWCPSCNGHVEVNIEDAFAAAKRALSGKK